MEVISSQNVCNTYDVTNDEISAVVDSAKQTNLAEKQINNASTGGSPNKNQGIQNLEDERNIYQAQMFTVGRRQTQLLILSYRNVHLQTFEVSSLCQKMKIDIV